MRFFTTAILVLAMLWVSMDALMSYQEKHKKLLNELPQPDMQCQLGGDEDCLRDKARAWNNPINKMDSREPENFINPTDSLGMVGCGIISFMFLARIRRRTSPSAKKHVYLPPGARLKVWAEFFFSTRAYEQILEPTLRDLLDEYFAALAAQRPWKARWICARGYYSFWSAVFAQLPISAVKMVYKIWQATR